MRECCHSEKWMVDPPEGKHLRICTGCAKRILECTFCDTKLAAGPHIVDSGWTKGGSATTLKVIDRWTACTNCGSRA